MGASSTPTLVLPPSEGRNNVSPPTHPPRYHQLRRSVEEEQPRPAPPVDIRYGYRSSSSTPRKEEGTPFRCLGRTEGDPLGRRYLTPSLLIAAWISSLILSGAAGGTSREVALKARPEGGITAVSFVQGDPLPATEGPDGGAPGAPDAAVGGLRGSEMGKAKVARVDEGASGGTGGEEMDLRANATDIRTVERDGEKRIFRTWTADEYSPPQISALLARVPKGPSGP